MRQWLYQFPSASWLPLFEVSRPFFGLAAGQRAACHQAGVLANGFTPGAPGQTRGPKEALVEGHLLLGGTTMGLSFLSKSH